ncbi:DUF4351 domain-containing protein [Sorangium sp. So ce1014]|uniref:DUF4351 domain-containing protein n=1 Tax=Sorangium sp. So ce1014 TaxID=3133326 RepID=UPI003F5F9B23
MSVADKLVEHGRREGLQEGRREGLQAGRREGLQAGRREGLQHTLLKLLGARFGALPEDIVARVNSADIPQLDRWFDRVLTATTLADALGDR